MCVCEIVYIVEYRPVGAPWDGGDKADVREKDGIIFDAIQGIVHLTEWQSVQLELELHLRQCRALTNQIIQQTVYLPTCPYSSTGQGHHIINNTM